MNSISDLMSATAAPASPGRRKFLRKSLIGTATAFALLGGHGLARPNATASVSAQQQSRGSSERLTGDDRDRMLRLATNNRHFTIIRDHFDSDGGRNWRVYDRKALRVLRDNRRERDTYWITYKATGEQTWVHVMYVRQADGREIGEGYLWRGERAEFTDRYHVQNGNLRRDNTGRVGATDADSMSAESSYAIPWPDNVDQVVCPTITYGSCFVGTATAAAGCAIPGINIFTCAGAATTVAACWGVSNDSNEACKSLDGS